MPPIVFKCLTAAIAAVSIWILCRKAFHLIRSRSYLRNVLLSAKPCQRAIANGQLKEKLQSQKASVLVSEDIDVPFAAGVRYILFPRQLLLKLSQEEFETVVAHELEHLQWKDPILKLISSITCSLFWWIPTQWWLKRLEADQEKASDLGIHKYGMDTLPLASAFVKTANGARFAKLKMDAISAFASNGYSQASRLENILNSERVASGPLMRLKFAAGIGLCLLTFLSFWIC
jgi:ABC-type Fe3+-siderophore transport system permease subunit